MDVTRRIYIGCVMDTFQIIMKPNNISDILENFDNEFKGYLIMTNGSFELYKPRKRMHEVIRSQIEQLLGRIDTGELSEYARKKETKERKLDHNQAHDLMAIYYGRNQKSSEIANQIKNLIQ